MKRITLDVILMIAGYNRLMHHGKSLLECISNTSNFSRSLQSFFFFFFLDKPQHHTDFILKHHNFNVMEFRYDSSGLLNHPDLAQASFLPRNKSIPLEIINSYGSLLRQQLYWSISQLSLGLLYVTFFLFTHSNDIYICRFNSGNNSGKTQCHCFQQNKVIYPRYLSGRGSRGGAGSCRRTETPGLQPGEDTEAINPPLKPPLNALMSWGHTNPAEDVVGVFFQNPRLIVPSLTTHIYYLWLINR